MYFLRSFSAHNVRTENRYIVTTFATLDHAHIGTYRARHYDAHFLGSLAQSRSSASSP